MLKFYSSNKNGQVLFLGLERINVTRLEEGKPFVLSLGEVDPRMHGTLVIAFGETKEDLLKKLGEAGITVNPGPMPEKS